MTQKAAECDLLAHAQLKSTRGIRALAPDSGAGSRLPRKATLRQDELFLLRSALSSCCPYSSSAAAFSRSRPSSTASRTWNLVESDDAQSTSSSERLSSPPPPLKSRLPAGRATEPPAPAPGEGCRPCPPTVRRETSVYVGMTSCCEIKIPSAQLWEKLNPQQSALLSKVYSTQETIQFPQTLGHSIFPTLFGIS